jgi:hypothetical protein
MTLSHDGCAGDEQDLAAVEHARPPGVTPRRSVIHRILFGSRGCFGRFRGAAGWLTWSAVVALLAGSGSDLAEEPAVWDARPVTLASESFPLVLPDPAYRAARRASATRRR